MNLKREYDAAVLGILKSDGQRIAELEAERDNAWTELREIRAAISANQEESTLDEVVKLRQQLADRDEQISDLTISSDTYFAERNSARDVWRRASKDRDELRQQLADMTAERDAYMRDYGKEQDRKREVAKKLAEVRAELEAERQRRWEGNRISSAELAASQKQVDVLLDVVREANKYIDQTYSDNLGRNCEWLAARYADSLSPMLLKAIAATEPKP